ncbi:sugar ABC transporter ATP-binding protein [Superficieibacter electus]|uniref:Sugar ABC transporter ATP-binding protein n=1 Tax=Superficieibacter electus TaxID=2022662 RepID=A0A2P5GLJ7_9ENTR|nr:sn-glycerol-3-phosphate ABC transporter ATP-binding protein UgpC [Superficieibacter electus]POP43822.1 sugar ABC transporter ATP-binding protein [Superficieibacter electus]POP46124.1 sugar ABC transporter ATP-binding protein [Superficieibacter electus]
MAEVKLTGVKKSFGKIDIIKGVDLTINDGEFVVFVGPSGCGKSTLLRMISGLEDLSAGELTIDGVRMNDAEPSQRGIAMVFQTYALYPHMTVRENMAFALKHAGVDKAEIEKKVMLAAKALELEHLLTRKPKALSGGQRQRVAIGRAIVRDPKVFLFDEPLSNLDAELRVQMRIEIARLHRELKSTTVYVTHDQIEAMTLADKIVVLRAGKIEQVGTPLELYDNPTNVFVAGFIGSPRMNFMSGIVVSQTDSAVGVRLPDFCDALLHVPVKSQVATGSLVKLGIRPKLFDDAGDSELLVTIDMLEHLGSETIAWARGMQGGNLTIETRQGRHLVAGTQYRARFFSHSLLMFGEDEQRIY